MDRPRGFVKAVGLILLAGIAVILILLLIPESEEKVSAEMQKLTVNYYKAIGQELLSSTIISNSDLPPKGTRSLFDHILNENKGIPFPFEGFSKLLASYDKEGRKPLSILIPDGRSLSKGRTSYHKPRVILAANAKEPESDESYGTFLKGRLFIGYVEEENLLEVLSYNESAGRFEFQLVENYYKGGTPRVTYARRVICVACHTNKAPIFPERPWDETTANLNVSKKLALAHQVDVADIKTATYFGVPLHTKLETPEGIDFLTDTASVVPTTQQIWLDGCGADGTECRRKILRMALKFLYNPDFVFKGVAIDYKKSDYQKQLLNLQEKAWPEHGIVLHNPDLLNRDPFVDNSSPKSMRKKILGLFKSKGGNARELENLEKLRAELDPLTLRFPKEILDSTTDAGFIGVSQLFSPNDKRLIDKYSNYKFENLEKAVASSNMDKALEAKPFNRVTVMNALLTELGVTKLPKGCCESVEGMSPPYMEGIKPLAISEGSVLKHYQTYCFACHRGNPTARLDFMSGETEEEVLEKIKNTTEIREVLDYERYLGTNESGKLMPPKSSYQRKAFDQSIADKLKHKEKMSEIIAEWF